MHVVLRNIFASAQLNKRQFSILFYSHELVWNCFTCFVRLSFLPNFFSQYLHLYSSPSFSWIVDTCRILFLILTNVFEHSSHWRLSESNVSCEDWICSFRVCFLPKIESQWLHLKRLVLSFLMKLIFSVDIAKLSPNSSLAGLS